jgi:hypothetical protein
MHRKYLSLEKTHFAQTSDSVRSGIDEYPMGEVGGLRGVQMNGMVIVFGV